MCIPAEIGAEFSMSLETQSCDEFHSGRKQSVNSQEIAQETSQPIRNGDYIEL